MLAAGLCIVGFWTSFTLGRRALWAGFVASILVGDLYGILRANIGQPASHFIFDAALSGLYLAALTQGFPISRIPKLRPLVPWVVILVVWPILLVAVPGQDSLIRLVGLRGQIFFIPILMIAGSFNGSEMTQIARFTAILNCVALAVALVETKLGLSLFYPHNAVDEIIYSSRDVLIGGAALYRIPSSFTSSAAYAGTMVISAPLLLGAMVVEPPKSRWRHVLLCGSVASAIGVFVAASRSAAVFEILMMTLFIPFARVKGFSVSSWIAILAGLTLLILVTPRMQRFLTLRDSRFVSNRLGSSVNTGFIQVVQEYPFGNGLGGGGSSIPYFLQTRVKNEMSIENEYGLILLEQGVPGLMMWLAFIFWLMTRPLPSRSDPWYTGKWLARAFCALSFATAPLGNGMLSAIPQTAMLMLYAGWIAMPRDTPSVSDCRRYARHGSAKSSITHLLDSTSRA